jgi:hypothetical protein
VPPQTASTPISRLPAETLAEIFEHVIALASEFSTCDSQVQLTQLAQVCPQWHSVFWEFPRLWGSLIFNNVVITAEMLRRSKESPLVVKVNFFDHSYNLAKQEAVGLALSHLSRIQIMHIYATQRIFKNILPAVDQPAPLLESLCLSAEDNDPNSTIYLPPSLSKLTAPRLHHLTIYGLVTPWSSPLLSGLTHLDIRDRISRPSLAEFRNVLSNCPALDTLILSKNLPSPIAPDNQNRPKVPVSLPHLSYLFFQGPVSECDMAINNIDFPPITEVLLGCGLNDEAEFLRLLPELAARCDHCVSPIRRLLIGWEASVDYPWATFRAWTNDDPHGKPSFCLECETEISHRRVQCTPLIRAVCERLSLTKLVSLELLFGDDVPRFGRFWQDAWPTMAQSFMDLEVLTVTTTHIGPLVSSLKPTPNQDAGAPLPWNLLLPHLLELVLREARFDPEILHNKLEECLKMRREHNSVLRTLRLHDCIGCFSYHVSRLNRVAMCVRWDGKVQRIDDNDNDDDEGWGDYFGEESEDDYSDSDNEYNEHPYSSI